MEVFVSFVVGFIFSVGLALAGMLQPQKIISFLDVTGQWDPSLLFVMVGAILVHAPLYKLIRKRKTPLLSQKWLVPEKKEITPQLIIGSVLFGIGWGLAGYCPGPALVSVGAFQLKAIIFFVSMLLGMVFYKLLEKRIPLKK